MYNNINERIKKNSNYMVDETIDKIQQMVRIDSVRDLENGTTDSFFGEGVGKCLDLFIEIASEIGMRTYRDPEGYYGYAEIGPENTEMLGIIAHLDVVPAGNESQWFNNAPFGANIVEDKIIGRGVIDDKGPLIVNLMAIKSLIQLGYFFPKRVRIIVGCDEETSWGCVEKYVALEEMPKLCYTPDGEFPCINAEKTIHQFELISDSGTNFTLKSLGAYNAVADLCSYNGDKQIELENELKRLGYEYYISNNCVVTIGKSAHAKEPQCGINAIVRMVEALNNIGVHSIATDFITKNLKEDSNAGYYMGDLLHENESGYLTLNIGYIDINNNNQKIGFDARIPVLLDENQIINSFKDIVEEVAIYNVFKHHPKLYVPIDDPFCATLVNIYRDVANEPNAIPNSTGGGSYAREMQNAVAFGMDFVNKGMACNPHQPNECLEIKFIEPALEIYSRAIYELTNNIL